MLISLENRDSQTYLDIYNNSSEGSLLLIFFKELSHRPIFLYHMIHLSRNLYNHLKTRDTFSVPDNYSFFSAAEKTQQR